MTRVFTVVWVLLAFALLFVGSLSFYEWYQVGIAAKPEVIAQYPFGSEGPVAGDAIYASASAYARKALHTGLFALPALCVVLVIGRAKSPRLLAVCYAVVIVAYAGRATGAL